MIPETIEPYVAWLVAGLLLASAEMLVPGIFLMWLGFAAIITGVAAYLLPIGIEVQLTMFAVLAVVSVFAGRRWSGSNDIASDDPLLNDRLARLVGEMVVVDDALADGRGRVRVGDGVWPAEGPDMAAGTLARVTGARGGTLLVEPLVITPASTPVTE